MARSPFCCEIGRCKRSDATATCEGCSAWICSTHAVYYPELGAESGWWCKACGEKAVIEAIKSRPTRSDAVEEAARAIVDDLDADGTHVVRHAHLEALRAALRREKGGA